MADQSDDRSPNVVPPDDDSNELAPALYTKTFWTEELAVAKPFLMPTTHGDGHEILPPEKENRKIQWEDEVHICEMPNRRMLGLADESEEDEDYEIEIVEDDGDADFYLEIVDGEIFYVFETEDDSDEEMEEYEDETDSQTGSQQAPLQLPIAEMMAPSLDDDETPKPVTPSPHNGISLAPPVAVPVPLSPSAEPELNLTDLSPRGRTGSLADASEDEHMEAPVSQDSFHESFHASDGSCLIQIESPVSSPTQDGKAAATTFVVSPLPSSPKHDNVLSPVPSSPTRSILKANPPSPRRTVQAKKKKEKTVTKTYVRADTFDGEHQVYTWEKPVWATENKLRETDKGSDVRKGANLASPITFPKRKKPSSAAEVEEKPMVYEDEKGNVIDKDELIRRIQEGDNSAIAFVPLPTYGGKHQRKLRFSEVGQKMRSGMDLAKPITKATVDRKRDDINHIAQPDKVLKKHVEIEKKEYSWSKPEWVRKASDRKLSDSSGHDTQKKEYKWEQPEWVKKKLSTTSAGEQLKEGGDLQKPITMLSQGAVRRRAANRTKSFSRAGTHNSGSERTRGVCRSKSLDLGSDFIIPEEK